MFVYYYMDEDDYEGLDELERIQLEDKIIEVAYDNSYRVLLKELTFDDLLNAEDNGGTAILAFDPDLGPEKSQLNMMLDYYKGREWFERCFEIKKLLDERFPE